MAPSKKTSKQNLTRVVLNLPPKTAATLEYLIGVTQMARSKSDLIVQMVNEYVDNRRDTLNDQESWKKFVSMFDQQKKDRVDAILSQFLTIEDDDYDEDENDED